jgi:hypothetical protein
VRRNGLVVGHGSSSVEVTSAAHVGGAWTRHRSGAIRETAFGSQAIVFANGMTEEFLTVERRLGPKTWRWRLEAGPWTPRLGADGGISFGTDHTLASFAIEPAKIFDDEGADVTPAGTRWSLRHVKAKWWLELQLDDSSLPLPYVIDPAISFRPSTTASNGGSGASSISLSLPSGAAARDLVVVQVAARGGTNMTIQTPAGWTNVLNSAVDGNLRQATFYRVVQTGDPTSVTFTFGGSAPVQRAVGGATAYYGVKTSAVVDVLAGTASTGTSGTATAAAITTTKPDSIVVTAYAAATSGGFGTPSGTTERYDVASGGTSSLRARAASHSYVQAAAGSTGTKTSSISSSRWLAHLLAFAVDDVSPIVSIADPGANLRQTITLQATASDADSGVVNVRFQRAPAGSDTWTTIGNPDTSAPYQVSFNTSAVADGLYDLRAVATDNAGNTAVAVTPSTRIDNGGPTVAITFPVAAGQYNVAGWSAGCTVPGFCGSAADPGSGLDSVEYSLRRSSNGLYWNGTAFAASTETFVAASFASGSWSAPFPAVSFPADGSYVVRARASDVAGNLTTLATRTFTLDTVPPNTTMSSAPPALSTDSTPTFTFTSSQGGSTFTCRMDAGSAVPCTSPFTSAALADGQHTFEVYATDPAGNADPTPATVTWRIDTTPPVVTVTNPSSGAVVSLTVAVTAAASDANGVVGVQFRLDGVALGSEDTSAPYTVPWNTRLGTNGPHTIAAVARDAIGNQTTASVQVTVDNNGVAGPGLVAAYAFDENAGTTAFDASGNANNGTLVGARWATGIHGSALFLDGVDDRVDLPALGTFYRSAFTFEAWVLKRGTRNDVAVIGTWDGDGPMIWTHHVNGRYMLTLGNGEFLDSGRLPVVGQWQHLGATYDGAVARFYIDGVQVASRPFVNDPSVSNVWRIGAFRASPKGFFDGLIDDARIYDRALPAAELAQDRLTTVGPIDVVPPSAPTGLEQVSATSTSVDVRWNAASDNVRVTGYRIYRNDVLLPSVVGTTARVSDLTCGTSYTIGVEAMDGAGNVSTRSEVVAVTAACDTTPPTVAFTSPSEGATLSGTVMLAATADDNDDVTQVTFSIDGTSLGSPDTTAPYVASWNTRLVVSGAHTVRATARDASGNTANVELNVNVDNAGAPGPGLVAGYGFDAGSGATAVDGSGNVNTATLVGATWDAGKTGSAVSLDGVDDRVDVPALGLFYRTAFTMEAWVKKAGAKKDVAVLGTWNLGTGGPMVWIDHVNGRYMLTLSASADNYLDSGVAPAVGTWQHVAVTFNGSVAKFFVDGAEVASRSFAGDVGTANTWRVGAYRSTPTGFFDGLIDDVRIYNRALPALEIQADLTTAVSRDIYAPSVESTSPEAGSAQAATTAPVTATFSEAMDPATVNAQTMTLRTQGGQPVPATVAYSAPTRTATLSPDVALEPETTYTVVIEGGAAGAADASGNPLRADVSWSFTTRAVPPPVLVVSSSANPFGAYAAEILEAEGLDAFDSLDLSQMSEVVLARYEVVVLGEAALSASQVSLLTDWVNDGGNLVALRPDKQLASLLGVTDAGGTLDNAYLAVDNSTEPGTGIVGQTIQFHGAADRYTLSGATAVATLYSDAATSTTHPAVTLRAIGTRGGQAAAFTYDLARSIVYTRQGNPAWAGQERDGVLGVRPNDLFFGGSATDPQPDWVDTSKLAIPQADEQQRLLVNLITLMARDQLALPRFWYFPRDHKAAVVMTEDDHGLGGAIGRFDQHIAASPPDCSVVDWECVRSTTYMYSTSPMTDAQASAYQDAGFEIAPHIAASAGCSVQWTFDSAFAAFSTQRLAFQSKYPSVRPARTNRSHCVTWDDWASVPLVELAHGVQLDTNYYAFPGSWIGDKPGFLTGSGMPMPFANLDGSVIDVYQATTQLNDEAAQAYPFTIDALLDRAVGPDGYFGYFVANAHADNAVSPESDAILSSAQAHDVPVISSAQLLDWMSARAASSFEAFSWVGNTMHFAVDADPDARGLRAMLPTQARGHSLTGLSRAGSSVSYETRVVKGVQYAVFPAVSGSYAAAYG